MNVKNQCQVEDVQNRIRNYVSSIKIQNSFFKILVDNQNHLSQDDFDVILDLMKRNIDRIDECIDKLIKIGEAVDNKIDDPNYNVEYEISKL